MPEASASLTLAFLRTRPQAAAKTLEQLPVPFVSDFLRQIPTENAATALSYLLSHYAALVAANLDAETSAALLSRLSSEKAADILRRIPKKQRTERLELFPAKNRKRCKALLAYDEEQIGAWMDPDILTLAADFTVEQALAFLQSNAPKHPASQAFVVDRDGGLKGAIPLLALLGSPATLPIANLLQPAPPSLTARSPVGAALQSPHWETHDALAVLNTKQRLIGVLYPSRLRTAAQQLDGKKPEPADKLRLAPSLLEDYMHTLWALATSAAGEYSKKPKS